MEQNFNSDMKLKYGNAHIAPLILLFIGIPTSAFKISSIYMQLYI